MDKFKQMLQMKAKDAKPMSNLEKNAKLKAVHQMRKMATDEMSEPLKNLKKVTVASNEPEGLKMGLEKAKQMLGHDPEMEQMEEETGEDLDHDNEEGEDPAHQMKVMGHEEGSPEEEASESPEEEKAEEEMSPEELQAKIHELQMMLQEKQSHKM